MGRGATRDFSVKVEQVFLAIFALGIRLYKEILHRDHALDQGYIHGVHITNQCWNLVNTIGWCAHLDYYTTLNVLAGEVVKLVLGNKEGSATFNFNGDKTL